MAVTPRDVLGLWNFGRRRLMTTRGDCQSGRRTGLVALVAQWQLRGFPRLDGLRVPGSLPR